MTVGGILTALLGGVLYFSDDFSESVVIFVQASFGRLLLICFNHIE